VINIAPFAGRYLFHKIKAVASTAIAVFKPMIVQFKQCIPGTQQITCLLLYNANNGHKKPPCIPQSGYINQQNTFAEL
jgi:hypothetical protein